MRPGYYKPGIELPKTDLLKAIAYLADAERLYGALPMQAMQSRAHMIRQLIIKLKTRLETNGK